MMIKKSNHLINREECPACGAELIEKIIGFDCWPDCLEKQLERKHREVSRLMVDICLNKQEVGIEFFGNEDGDWGWTFPSDRIMFIPWYTLRNKEEFFDTIAHEVGHITAFEIFFDSKDRGILKKFEELKERVEDFSSFIYSPALGHFELWSFRLRNQALITKYERYRQESKEDHWHDPWWLEYENHFKNLLISEYACYAYGATVRPPENQKKFVL